MQRIVTLKLADINAGLLEKEGSFFIHNDTNQVAVEVEGDYTIFVDFVGSNGAYTELLSHDGTRYVGNVPNDSLAIEGKLTLKVRIYEGTELITSKSMDVLARSSGSDPIMGEGANAKLGELETAVENAIAITEDIQSKLDSGYFKGETGETGEQGEQGIQGIQGVQGEPFAIKKAYSSIELMNADYSNTLIKVGQFVFIDTGNVEDADNAKLYYKGLTEWVFSCDLSGAEGITGPQGVQGEQGLQGPQGLPAEDAITIRNQRDNSQLKFWLGDVLQAPTVGDSGTIYFIGV